MPGSAPPLSRAAPPPGATLLSNQSVMSMVTVTLLLWVVFFTSLILPKLHVFVAIIFLVKLAFYIVTEYKLKVVSLVASLDVREV